VQLSRYTQRLLAALAATSALGATTAALAAGEKEATTARVASASAVAYSRDDGDGQRGLAQSSGTGSDRGGGTSARTSTAGGKASASASAQQHGVRLFGGLVTADSVTVRASATNDGATRSGSVRGLVIDGQEVGTQSRRRSFDMGGHGKLVVVDDRGRGIVGLNAKLTRDYGRFAAGNTAKVAYAAASARDAVAPPKPEPEPEPEPKPDPKPEPKPEPDPEPDRTQPKAERREAPRTETLATDKGFVFPVYGKYTYTNDWGAPRATTGIHEGNDIFAPTGTPVVAVCDGSLNRVGTLPISGNRLWVKCDKGRDSFFYAHLSAFATETRNGLKVKAGTVLGFVGSTGDAEQTPPHVHFEVHPRNGDAVNPYPFLRAWEGRRDVPAAAWVRRNGTTAGEQPGTLVVVDDFLDR
jgi:murein DD-endopeptidase MepM/ murein hydrolase activator NlpD